jgi:hypothetical protein
LGVSRTTGFPLRPALIAVAVVVLLGLVAAASRSDRPSRPADPDGRTLPLEFWDYAVTLGLIAIVAVLALAIFMKVPITAPRDRRFGFSQLIAIGIISALVVLAGTRMEWPERIGGDSAEEGLLQNERTEEATPQAEDSSGRKPRAAEFQWPVLFGAGTLVLLGAAVYFARRRFAPERQLVHPAASALSAALDESVDDLRAERDPRRAVIAAYARMERALDRHGFPRIRSEAPLEYLARVLRELRVRSGAVLALTELFERAKFSRHEIDADMKEEAIGALIAVRDDLRPVS